MLALIRPARFWFAVLPILGWSLASMIGIARASDAPAGFLYDIKPGPAHASIQSNQIVLENNLFTARWSLARGTVGESELILRPSANEPHTQPPKKTLALSPDIFVFKLKDGTILRSSTMSIKAGPIIENLAVEPADSRLAHTSQAGRSSCVWKPPTEVCP